MAALCDIYVMDAFGTAHRAEASTHGVAKYAPVACGGPLLVSELTALETALEKPARPLLAIVAGSKVSTKLTVLETLLSKVDQMIVGGGIANTFLAARGFNVGKSLHEPDMLDICRRLIEQSEKRGIVIPMPIDVVVATEFSAVAEADVKPVGRVADNEMILDIGPDSAEALAKLIAAAGTILWNGPVGVFEFDQFGEGTRTLANAIARSKAFSLAGGGDTLAAIEKYGVEDSISYISTGGGAFLEFVEGKKLPAVDILGRARRHELHPAPDQNRRHSGSGDRRSQGLADMVRAGVDVVRINFSHGALADHARRLELVRDAAKRAGRYVGVLGDLQGPKIRMERFVAGKVHARRRCGVRPRRLARRGCRRRARGRHRLQEAAHRCGRRRHPAAERRPDQPSGTSIEGPRINTRVLVGGELGNNKGINRQGGGLSAGALTDKDREDIGIAASLKVDYLAVSFPRDGADMNEARKLLRAAGSEAC